MKIPAGQAASMESIAYLEQFYADYHSSPETVSSEWQDYFGQLGNGHGGRVKLGPSFSGRPAAPPFNGRMAANGHAANLTGKLHQLIHNHRARGHVIAAINPLDAPRPCPPELELDFYGFAPSELDLLVTMPDFPEDTPLSVREIFDRLRDTYCRSIGVEFMHIDSLAVRQWLQRRMESSRNRLRLSRAEQLRIVTRLTDAVVFEQFLRTKFPGAKTFSLEGCETLLPLLDLALEKASRQGAREVILGMGHRGRLNVLAHIAGKDPSTIFREFADAEPEMWGGGGDVKYHLGHSGEWESSEGRRLHVSLCFNPSHLEFVNPVTVGRVRARQDRADDRDRRQILGLLIHGDAAFAGQGVVQETLNLSKLPGYAVGGVLHVVVNNQIGFTTSPNEARSTMYATDAARMLRAPIFHVNGEDPEAVAQVVQLAMDFRAEFQSDVFIDMYGYRRLGHNETDEPSFTQPLLYRQIAARPNIRESYVGHLTKLNSITAAEAENILGERRASLEKQLEAARGDHGRAVAAPSPLWQRYHGGREPDADTDTGVSPARLNELLLQLATVPPGFNIHPKLEQGLAHRREMAAGRRPVDWAAAEALALATLAAEGVRIRLTGQDSGRGTFSHRHAIWYDQQDGSTFVPLQHLATDQAPVEIINSPLSETGTVGFEYGYTLDCPDGLVLWEAQFGDFVNGAQVILDQFITSAEAKWRRLSGLVLLLPHGLEGMGPEHSSARLERFLALAAEDNIQIAQPTTPAQYFHLLRRQALNPWRKPLVVLTPKSLLRSPRAVSSLDDCARGPFQRILPDAASGAETKRILLCTGKVYYDLKAHQEEQRRQDVAIFRLEELYPLHPARLESLLNPFSARTPVLWVQEEPANMGAWRYLHEKFGKLLLNRFPLALISRAESPSPATGSAHAHKLEQANLVHRAFGESQSVSAEQPPIQEKV